MSVRLFLEFELNEEILLCVALIHQDLVLVPHIRCCE